MPLPADRTPVIIGVGEVVDRPADPALALEPLALMEAAIRAADADAGARTGPGFLARIDSLDIINLVSWRYDKVASRLAERLGITPARSAYGVVGGETPTTKIHEAALRIMNGNSIVAVVTGGEATNAVAKARAAGINLPWTPPAAKPENPIVPSDHVTALAVKMGVMQPVHIYPLYENAATAAWGLTPAEALAESGTTWARFAAVAAQNPNSWSKTAYGAAEITTPTPDNRMIAYPYTKRMVANPAVNQAAAVLLTSLAVARAAGVPDDRIVYVHGGAAAAENYDYMARDQYRHSVAQDAVLAAVMRLAPAGFDRHELYSCFPIVPKMARRTLGLAADAALTVTGGLSFFGAPLNTYMTHATCAMVRSLRDRPAEAALLYGQGGYVTKHHGLVVGSVPPEPSSLMTPVDVQAEAEAMREPVPAMDPDYEGAATLETFTVVYDRDGAPAYGGVAGRTADGARVFGRVPADDADTLALLLAADVSPVGTAGRVSVGSDGLQRWEV